MRAGWSGWIASALARSRRKRQAARLVRERRTVTAMLRVYCHGHHARGEHDRGEQVLVEQALAADEAISAGARDAVRASEAGAEAIRGKPSGPDRQAEAFVRVPGLCTECSELHAYVMLRLDRCPFGETKPTCAACPIHCYKPDRRQQIRDVMRYAGPRMLWRHPIYALWHLWDGRRTPGELPRKKTTAYAANEKPGG